jgi:hypothetical protein
MAQSFDLFQRFGSIFFLEQLVCFYYVLTTFTTVGYGMYATCLFLRALICVLFCPFHFDDAGDISAANQGERVGDDSSTDICLAYS